METEIIESWPVFAAFATVFGVVGAKLVDLVAVGLAALTDTNWSTGERKAQIANGVSYAGTIAIFVLAALQGNLSVDLSSMEGIGVALAALVGVYTSVRLVVETNYKTRKGNKLVRDAVRRAPSEGF